MKLYAFFLIAYFFCPLISKGKDYKQYYLSINNATSYAVAGHFEKSIELYDDTFRQYKFVFARDVYDALLISILAKKKNYIQKNLEKCIEFGVDTNFLYVVPFVDSNVSFLKDTVRKKYISLNNTYKSMFDLNLKKIISEMYYYDREAKSSLNLNDKDQKAIWYEIMASNFKKYDSIVKSKGHLIGEKTIGIDNMKAFGSKMHKMTTIDHGKACVPNFYQCLVILMHEYCSIIKLNSYWEKAILDGELHPSDYASVYEYCATKTPPLICKSSFPNRYYTLSLLRQNIPFIDSCRNAIYMSNMNHLDSISKFNNKYKIRYKQY
jgi:hypothetical protein